MTVITYGKSTFAGNAKTRRHERRRKLAIERDTICNIIDSIFGCDAPDASQEVKTQRVDREAANRRSAELGRDCWTYENTVKTLLERAESAESACTEAARILKSGERMALTRAVNILLSVGEDAAPYRYPVVLPEPLGFKPPSGRDVLLKNDVIAALMSAGVPVERG
ncbi:hypothetical protein FXG27_02430 [Salmonella enterica]|nr:hypothetical protein [Salmonella enterica]